MYTKLSDQIIQSKNNANSVASITINTMRNEEIILSIDLNDDVYHKINAIAFERSFFKLQKNYHPDILK